MLVNNHRPIAVRPAVAANAVTTVERPQAPARRPAVEVKAQGPRQSIGWKAGAVGGGIAGLVGMGGLVLFTSLAGATWATAWAAGVILGGAAVGALGGAAFGSLVGAAEDAVLGKVAKNPTSQWGFYFAGYGVLGGLWSLLRGTATGLSGALGGVGTLLVGGWQTAVEVKGLKEGGPLTDNKLRLAGAAVATVGGLATAAALVPAVAAVAPWMVAAGVGVSVLGWGANLVGQFMNERRNIKP